MFSMIILNVKQPSNQIQSQLRENFLSKLRIDKKFLNLITNINENSTANTTLSGEILNVFS
jgi:hypothetical protein